MGAAIFALLALIGAARVIRVSWTYSRRALAAIGRCLASLESDRDVQARVARIVAKLPARDRANVAQ
jgi:hypothetical protein